MKDAATQPGLFDIPRTRWSDPQTSRQAAESISLERLTNTQQLVLTGLGFAPATDEELIDRFRSRWPSCKVSDQSIRSRRAELVRRGLVEDSGERHLTRHGQRSTVWRTT